MADPIASNPGDRPARSRFLLLPGAAQYALSEMHTRSVRAQNGGSPAPAVFRCGVPRLASFERHFHARCPKRPDREPTSSPRGTAPFEGDLLQFCAVVPNLPAGRREAENILLKGTFRAGLGASLFYEVAAG